MRSISSRDCAPLRTCRRIGSFLISLVSVKTSFVASRIASVFGLTVAAGLALCLAPTLAPETNKAATIIVTAADAMRPLKLFFFDILNPSLL